MALRIYDDQNPKHPFKSLPAWEVLRLAPKWIIPCPPPGPLSLAIASSAASSDPVSSLNTPLSLPSDTPPTPPRPIGVKQAKRKRVALAKEEADDDDCKELLKRSSELAMRRVEAMEEGNRLKREMARVDAEAKASLVQVNELKVLLTPGASCETDLAKEVLILMQKKLKEKYMTSIDAESSSK